MRTSFGGIGCELVNCSSVYNCSVKNTAADFEGFNLFRIFLEDLCGGYRIFSADCDSVHSFELGLKTFKTCFVASLADERILNYCIFNAGSTHCSLTELGVVWSTVIPSIL